MLHTTALIVLCIAHAVAFSRIHMLHYSAFLLHAFLGKPCMHSASSAFLRALHVCGYLRIVSACMSRCTHSSAFTKVRVLHCSCAAYSHLIVCCMLGPHAFRHILVGVHSCSHTFDCWCISNLTAFQPLHIILALLHVLHYRALFTTLHLYVAACIPLDILVRLHSE